MPQPAKSYQCDLRRNNAYTNANGHTTAYSHTNTNRAWTDANTDAGNIGRSRVRRGDVDGVAGGDWIVAFRRNVVAGVLT